MAGPAVTGCLAGVTQCFGVGPWQNWTAADVDMQAPPPRLGG